jgi:energy-coupling factor transport system ATP-binding protein
MTGDGMTGDGMTGDGMAAGQKEVIRLSNVQFRYPGADSCSLQGIDLVLYKGDFIAVAGSNGSGKSTMCKTFNGLIPQYYAGELEGEVLICGAAAEGQSVSALSRQVAYVFQDFENQLVRPTVLEEVTFPPLNFGYADYKERGMQALRLLGLEHLKEEWIWQLSGGQKHMVALASALSLDPEVIVIDEPVAQLDPARARIIYDKLKMLNEQLGKTIVVIEHHTEFIADYCRRLALMEGGRLLWVKPVQEGLSQVEQLLRANIQPPQATQAIYALETRTPARLYPVTLEQAVQHLEREYGSGGKGDGRVSVGQNNDGYRDGHGCGRDNNGYCDGQEPGRDNSGDGPGNTAAGTDRSHAGFPQGAAPLGPSEHLNPELQIPACQERSAGEQPVIRIAGVVSGYRDLNRSMKPVLKGIDLSFYPGERVAIVGNNGAGKSTLMRLISGIRRPWEGEVAVCGLDTRRVSPERLADHVAFLFQNPEEMFIQDDIRKDIEYYLKARKQEPYLDFVDDIVSRFRLTDIEKRDGRLLSGGQQRRATLAIGLAMRPAVMLLDEPTASLDIASRREMTLLLEQLKDRIQVVLVATHDMQLVADWATRVIVMHQGRVLLDGDSRTVFQRTEVVEKAALIPPQIVQLSARLGMNPVALSVEEFAARYHAVTKEEIALGSR